VRIYIACGLTHVPRDKFQHHVMFIHTLALELERSGCEVRYALRDSDPLLATRPAEERARLCYVWDREMVEWADALVAEASFSSTGLGIELQIAAQKGIPIVLCFSRGEEYRVSEVEYENPDRSHHNLQIGEGYVTLMALGIPTIFKIICYGNNKEAVQAVLDATSLIRNSAI
jgi:hypothetical protein